MYGGERKDKCPESRDNGKFLVSTNTASLGDDVLHVLNLPLATGEGTEL